MLQAKSIVRCIGVIIFFSLQISSYSQSNYTFTPSSGTYSSISGTDVTLNYSPVNIGFTFKFDGVNYTQVVPSKWGWLSFNTGVAPIGDNLKDGDLKNTLGRPLIGVLYAQNKTTSGYKSRYNVSGTSPNRIFTFEWYNWTWQWYTNNDICFQVKLYETSNKIEFIYQPINSYFNWYDWIPTSIGLAFANQGEFLSVSDFGAAPTVSTSNESHNINTMPANGQTYTFELNTPKPEPANQATGLTASVAGDNMLVTWFDATGAVLPDGYVVFASKTNSFADPVDGTSFVADIDLSDGTGVVKVPQGQQSYYGWVKAESATNYYFKVYSYTNSGGLVNYNTISAPSTQVLMVKGQPSKHVTNFRAKNVSGSYTFEWTDVSKFGNSLRFDDANTSHVDCGNSNPFNVTGNAITLEAWVNMNQTYGDLFHKENASLDGGYRMYGNSTGQLCFGLYVNGTWSEIKSPINSLSTYCWSHICGTYDGTTQKLYINSNLVASKAITGNIGTSSSNLFIGKSHTASVKCYDGKMDEIMIWSVARSQTDILNDMCLRVDGTENGLSAYYACNQGVADGYNAGLSTLYDLSSNAIPATLQMFQLQYSTANYTTSNTSSETDGYLILASETGSFPNVVNGTDFAADNDLSDGVGAVKVLQGVKTYSSWTNLNVSKTYSYRIYPYTNSGTSIAYYTNATVPQVTIKPEPINHATGFTSTPSLGNVAMSWIDAVGSQIPDGYIILASKTGVFTAPTDGTEIVEDKDLSDGVGAVRVLNGVESFSQWTGFETSVIYYFRIYPFTNSDATINYKTDGTIPEISGSILVDPEPTFHATNFTAVNSGTLALTWKDAFNLKNCLSFDGSDDYITCGAQNSSIFTLEAWVNPTLVNADQAVVSTLNEGGLTGCELHIGATGKPVLTIKNSGAWLDVISSTAVIANTWTHLAATYNGSSVILYINGVQVATQAAASYTAGVSPLVIGRRSSSLLNFNGKIDEVRVWNTVRSVTDINANMTSELIGTEAGLMSYYKFNQGTSSGNNATITTLSDASSNGRTGTLNNFTLTGITSNWVKANQAPAGYLIKASTTNSFTDPIDFTDVSSDNDLSDGVAVVKVAQGIQKYLDWTGLNGQTTYYFKIYPYTNEGSYIDFKTTPTTPAASIAYIKTRPITHVTNIAAARTNLSWTDATVGIPSLGNAVRLDGIDDFITVPAIGNNMSKFTIETWFNSSSLTGNFSGIYNNNSWVVGAVHFQINSGNIELAVAGGATYTVDVSHTFATNTWYHLATTYNAGEVKIFVNGTLIGSGTLSTKIVNLAAAQLGAWNNSRYFNGKFDEYRIWNTERSQPEIFNNMYSELSGSETGLLVYYKLNQGVAEGNNAGLVVVSDASPSAINGTLTNFGLTGTSSNWVGTGDLGHKVAAPDGYLIKASKNKNIVAPVDGTVIADDLNLSDDVGCVNVLQGVQTYNGWTNANDTTRYYFKVFPYTNSGTARVYNNAPVVPTANDSTGIDRFKEISAGISNLVNGKSKWADYDNDGDLDLLLFGSDVFTINSYTGTPTTTPINCVTKLYQNNGSNNFAEVSKGFVNISNGDAAWGDYNNDGLIDLIITGVTQYKSTGKVLNSVTNLYKQLPDHSFEVQDTIVLPTLAESAVAWGDYDNDGDLDILISGSNTTPEPNENFAKIYCNNGNNSFTAQSQIAIEAIQDGSVAWGDYNNDGFLDFMITGYSNKGQITKIYKNNQNNFFFEQKDIGILGLDQGSAVWGDYDNDGDLDILLNGNSGATLISTIYKNDYPINSFTQVSNLNLTATSSGNAQWGDINIDGLMDIVVTGNTGVMSYSTTEIFLQNPDHTFSQYSTTAFKTGSSASISLADYDGDNDLDLFVTGYHLNPNFFFSALYQNNLELYKKNTTPIAPVGLEKTYTKHMVLSWKPITGDITPSKGLSYNIRIGKTSRGNEVTSSMSDTTANSGFRKVVSVGNCNQNTFKILNLPPSTGYFWSVQAIDNSYIGGNFSEEKTFDIDTLPASGLKITKISETKVSLKWTRGNGNRCAVFCIIDSSSNSAKPVMKQKYIHSSTFTEGEKINSTGWYCVYNGLNDSVIVNGLSSNTTFTAQIIEYVYDSNDAPRYFRQTSPNNDDWGIFSTGQYSGQTVSVIDDEVIKIGQWADFNKDGYIDYVFNTHSLPLTQQGDEFYAFNNGNNFFVKNTSLGVASNTTIKVADFNNDEYHDLIITDRLPDDIEGSSYDYYSYLRLNDHSGGFYGVPISLPVMYLPSIDLADFDNDGYIDIAMCGRQLEEPTDFMTKIYHNNQDSTFSEVFSLISSTVVVESISWGDYDNDGYLDFLLNGRDSTEFAKVYKNLGNNLPVNTSRFQEVFRIERAPNSDSYWNDADDDGDLDIIINDLVYANNYPVNSFQANGNSVEYSQQWSSADYDNDGDVDYFSGGTIYRNNSIVMPGAYQPNRVPEIPTNLKAIRTNGKIKLKWSAITSDETDSTMTYDVRLRKTGETNWFNAPQTSASGFRRTISLGRYKTNYANTNLPIGDYEWQVQAIDQGYQSSNWSAINSFSIASYFTADTVCLGDSTAFIDHTTTLGEADTWHWDFGDSTYSATQSPKHKYLFPGEHIVKFTVNSVTTIDTILVKPTPNVLFTATDVCSGTTTTIVNSTGIADVDTWSWDFGDGNSSSYANPASHTYGSTGNYTINLSVIAKSGCSADASRNIVVTTTPNATLSLEYGTSTFCRGDSVIYSVPDNSNYSYQWKRDGFDIAEKTSLLKVKDISGNYQVYITNKLAATCTATSVEKQITVKERPGTPVIEPPISTSFCGDKTMLLTTAIQNDVAYQWLLNGGTVKDSTRNQLVANSSGEFSVKVSNVFGCEVISNSVSLTMIPRPELPSMNYGKTNICDGKNVTFSVNSAPGISYQWFRNSEPQPGATSNIFAATTQGDYFLQVSNSNLCTNRTNSVSVTVNNTPDKPIIGEVNNTTSYCPGTEVELNVKNSSPNVLYQWKRSITVIDGANQTTYKGFLSSGDYLVEAKVGECAIESEVITLTTKPAPPKPALFAKGPNVWLLACDNTTAKDYQWYFNDNMILGAKSNQYVANQNYGNYYVAISDGGDCYTASDVITITAGGIVNGVTELFGDAILVHPNPTTGLFNVALGNTLPGVLYVEIVDAFGRSVARYQFLNSMGFSVDLSESSDGIYFCKMSYQNSNVVKKIIKQ